MEKTLIRQNAQWSGRASGFQICYELNDMSLKRELNGFDLENVALEKKILLTYNQKETYGDVEALPFVVITCANLRFVKK